MKNDALKTSMIQIVHRTSKSTELKFTTNYSKQYKAKD